MNECIAVASQDNNGLSSPVSEHFGRSAFFALGRLHGAGPCAESRHQRGVP